MAPLDPSNTPRYFLDYTVAGEQHTMLIRTTEAAELPDVVETVDTFLTALGNSIFTLTVNGMRYAAPGSNVTNPVPWSGASSYGSGTGIAADTANYYDFIGRSPTGRRVRVTVFGAAISRIGTDYRAEAGASVNLDLARANLDDDPNVWVAIDGTVPVWKAYVNLGINAYWRNEIR